MQTAPCCAAGLLLQAPQRCTQGSIIPCAKGGQLGGGIGEGRRRGRGCGRRQARQREEQSTQGCQGCGTEAGVQHIQAKAPAHLCSGSLRQGRPGQGRLRCCCAHALPLPLPLAIAAGEKAGCVAQQRRGGGGEGMEGREARGEGRRAAAQSCEGGCPQPPQRQPRAQVCQQVQAASGRQRQCSAQSGALPGLHQHGLQLMLWGSVGGLEVSAAAVARAVVQARTHGGRRQAAALRRAGQQRQATQGHVAA